MCNKSEAFSLCSAENDPLIDIFDPENPYTTTTANHFDTCTSLKKVTFAWMDQELNWTLTLKKKHFFLHKSINIGICPFYWLGGSIFDILLHPEINPCGGSSQSRKNLIERFLYQSPIKQVHYSWDILDQYWFKWWSGTNMTLS